MKTKQEKMPVEKSLNFKPVKTYSKTKKKKEVGEFASWDWDPTVMFPEQLKKVAQGKMLHWRAGQTFGFSRKC